MPSVWSRLLPSALRKHLALRVHRDAVARRERAFENPKRAQEESLEQLVRLNQQTEFGRTHGFSSASTLNQYIARVPLRGHGEYAPLLERQARGGDVLVANAIATVVEYAEPASTAFPLSPAGLEHWQWWEALLQDHALRQGRDVVDGVWLSLPPLAAEAPAAGSGERLPLGERWDLLGPARAGADRDPLPTALWEIDNEEDRYYLILRLAIEEPVRVLRTENPGTLAILADHLERQADKLLDHLASGVVQTREAYEGIPSLLKPAPERAKELSQKRRDSGQLEPAHLWPDLALLICQTNGAARAAAERLPDRYGGVLCVDPGLFVAGAPITTADEMGGIGGWALLDGLVLEMQEANAPLTTPALSALGLEVGGRYTPIISCHNGLYRYRSGRLVEVTEIDERGTPRLAPAGRRETEVEVAGEWLQEEDVRKAQRDACRALDVLPRQQCCFIDQLDDLPQVGSEALDRPIWARLFSREPPRVADPNAPQLCWAIEPSESLSSDNGRRLLAHFEASLRQQSKAFASLRGEQALGIVLLVLRRGTFARRKHRRLADGQPGGHAPLGALLEVPLGLKADEIDRRVG